VQSERPIASAACISESVFQGKDNKTELTVDCNSAGIS
jgi:hypothetical protein